MKAAILSVILLFQWAISNTLAQASAVHHSPKAPRSGTPVTITVRWKTPVESALLEYQVVQPGGYIALRDPAYQTRWTQVKMAKAEDAAQPGYAGQIPASAQAHRNLVRYRIRLQESDGKEIALPAADDAQPNYAYFVYDAIPSWKGAIDPSSWDRRKSAAVSFGPDVMGQVQNYFLIGRVKDVENATWYQPSSGNQYQYTGTFVADGKVYDHVPFRARGGVWRHAMGKNMWKFNFNKGHHLEAKDDYGQAYKSKWGKLNLRACIQQGDYGRRGEQGMYEAVGFRLFNLVGADAPRTHWVSLRIVSEREESPANQYRGDFWGLYLAIENEDGDFLEEHDLPDGNVYKMMFGQGELSHQGKGQPADRSDLQQFRAGLGRASGPNAESWWRSQVDLPRYYSYRSIVEAIHHYDIGDGKNYDFYFNPKTAKWCVIPWDIDLTWGDHMYGSPRGEPFYRALSHPPFKLEYQNRLREIRDLLFNSDEAGRLIDECASIIWRPGKPSIVDADRMKWDYHPIMASAHVMQGKADQGLFYRASPGGDFAGMVDQMKEYVKKRAAVIDRVLVADNSIPATPGVTYIGPEGFGTNRLQFKTSAYKGSGNFAAMEWRAGEINSQRPGQKPRESGHYEITPAWQSGELTEFKEEIAIGPAALQAGHSYRVRCRMKDSTGRWSHWSAPIQFTAGNQ